MNPKGRRWIALLKDVLVEHPNLVEAVKRDDGPEIVSLLQQSEAEAQHDLDDFRRTHPKLDAKMRRLRSLDTDYYNDDLDDDLWDRARELRDDPEVDWYKSEFDKRLGVVLVWRNRVEWAKDIAGIEPVRDRYADEDD